MDSSQRNHTAPPLFLFLLPVFFSLHGLLENLVVAPWKAALEVAGWCTVAALLLMGAFFLLFRHWLKAALAAFVLLAFNLFFGALHDILKTATGGGLISRYTLLLPLFLVLFILFIVFLKRSRESLYKVARYLNFLFFVLIAIDAVQLILKPKNGRHVSVVPEAATVNDAPPSKPDVYLILADEYAGKQELADLFRFSNAAFETELRNRGFHLTENSRSNYNWTIYSMASMLNMGYLQHLRSRVVNNPDMLDCAELIKKSRVVRFFEGQGYRFYNHSIFDVSSNERAATSIYLPTKYSLLTAQTFVRRFQKDLGFHFSSNNQIEAIKKRDLYNNEEIYRLTIQAASDSSTQPRFVYTHLILPHYPYHFDSSGREAPKSALEEEHKLDTAAYLGYLQYANKKLLRLIDRIRGSATRPPLIILMSDHGFRQFTRPVPQPYHFMNLNAVLLPDRNYQGFYPGLSNVNQFRVLLNNQFAQQLPLLKDSTFFLWEGQ